MIKDLSSIGINLACMGFLLLCSKVFNWSDMTENKLLFPVLTVFLLGSLATMWVVKEPPAVGGEVRKGCRQEVNTLARLWKDLRIMLLAISAFSQGFASSWKSATFSDAISEQLGESSISLFNFLQPLVGLVIAKPIGWSVPHFGMGTWMLVQAVVYFMMPMLYWYLPVISEGWGMLYFYFSMAVVDTIYSVVVQAILLEHFPGDQAAYVFATMTR